MIAAEKRAKKSLAKPLDRPRKLNTELFDDVPVL